MEKSGKIGKTDPVLLPKCIHPWTEGWTFSIINSGFDSIERLAKKEGVSLSLKVRDLVKEALEIEEDLALSQFAAERDKIFKKTTTLRHEEVW